MFTKYGAYVAPEKRRADNTVYRGCYVLDIRKVLELYCLKIHCPSKAPLLSHTVFGSDRSPRSQDVVRLCVRDIPQISTLEESLRVLKGLREGPKRGPKEGA